MKRILSILTLLSAALLSGCATQEYKMYADTQRAIASANATAESARYAALAEIAKTGDSAAKVAAVMSINFGNAMGNNGRNQQVILPPKTAGDIALQWTSILLPNLTNLYGINANRQVAIAQSNNQAAVAQSTNNTFAAMNTNMANSNSVIAKDGFTAVTNVANSGLNTTADVAKAGITGIVTTSTNALSTATTINSNSNTAITNVSNSANASLQALINQLKELQPNVTTTTNNTTPPSP
jgi:hypothetical protein